MDPGSKKRTARLLLVLAVVIGAASIALEYRFDLRAADERAAAERIDVELGALQLTLQQLHAAQTAYTAQAQDPETWMRQVDETTETASIAFARFGERNLSPAGQVRVDAAAGAFEVLLGADGRARQAVRDDRRLPAADAIFLDSANAVERASAEIAAARAVEREARGTAADSLTRVRQISHALAVGLILLFAVVVGRLRLQPQASEAATMAQMLRELPPPVKASPARSAAAASAPETTETQIEPRTGEPVAEPLAPETARPAALLNLQAAAELCGDLARVIDARDVPALLARAAGILDARGIIIWVADRDGRQLEPVLTHGYPDKVIRRLEALTAEADNVTSLAFRTRRAQQLATTGSTNHGAVAIPLVTASGCVGVMAAEVSAAGLARESVALARVVGAQFATIIAPETGGTSEAARA